jgi:predicted RNA-binding protein with RPS1 domain
MSGRDDRSHHTFVRSSSSTRWDNLCRDALASSSSPLPPKEGDIFEGKIIKIESYGAFCSLLGTWWQGLIHISQLYCSRVEHVEDVVSLNDIVWVKVIQVEQPQNQSQSDCSDRRPRLRIKLSMKDVSQDGSRKDLGRQRDDDQQVKAQLETNLNAMIGVGVARDPMVNARLILKGMSNATSTTVTSFRGGYTLVGNDEGEVSETEPPTNVASDPLGPHSTPIGRGRGATLPAWMTSTPVNDGPVGDKKKGAKNRSSDNEIRNDKKRNREKKSSEKDQRGSSKKQSKKKHKRYRREHSSSGGEDYDSSDCSFSRNGDRRRSERPCKRGRKGHSSFSHNEKHRKVRRRHKKSRDDDSASSRGSSTVDWRRGAAGDHH